MMVSTGIFRRYRNIKHYCTAAKTFQEVRIPVPWGNIAGKWWGPTDKRPVLCLHGWQDNSGTYNRLLPLLHSDTGFLAIDFPGHGYSSHYPAGLYIHNKNYRILVQYIKKYFNWPKLSLMGHSLGGMTAFVTCLLFPDDIDFVIAIDCSKPLIHSNLIARLENVLGNKFFKYNDIYEKGGEGPAYSYDEIKHKISTGNSVDYKYSHHIVNRIIAPSSKDPQKYCLIRDVRLKIAREDLVNWSQAEILENVSRITCPLLICKATDGPYYEDKKNLFDVVDVLKKCNKDFEFHLLHGNHHIHLNNPEELANCINVFISKHDKEDRSVGGIKEEIIFKERTVEQLLHS